MRKHATWLLFLLIFIWIGKDASAQCPPLSGISNNSMPVSCFGGTNGSDVFSFNSITIAGPHFFGLYKLPNTLVTVRSGSSGPFTFTGLSSGNYEIRYFNNKSGPLSCGSLASPVLIPGSSFTIDEPEFPVVNVSSFDLCESDGQFMIGSSPIPPNGQSYYAEWVLAGPGSPVFTPDKNSNFVFVSNLQQGNYTAYWVVSVAGCGAALTSDGTNLLSQFQVEPLPSINSALTSTVCSGNTFNHTFTSTVSGSTFDWQRPAVTGIVGSVPVTTSNTISETLTNTSSSTINVFYPVTATGPGATSCQGIPAVLTVTVYPAPVVTFTGSTTYCSGQSTNISLSSNLGGTSFSWTTSVSSGIVNGHTSGTGPLISQNLTGNGMVNYIITPVVGTTSCPGTQLVIPVIVNPLPTVTGISIPPICSGNASNITYSSIPAGASFAWSVTGLSGGLSASSSAGAGTSINSIFTNSTSSTLTGLITISPTIAGTGCVGPSTTISQIVFPNPIVTSTSPGVVCSGRLFNYSLTANIPVSGFIIARNSNSNIQEPATTINGTVINETLTGIGFAPVTVIYTITPISASSCPGNSFDLNVVVNPRPMITSFSNSPICSSNNTNITIVSTPSGTSIGWTRAAQPGIINGASSGIGSGIMETLTSNTSTGVSINYLVTPTVSGCVGNTTTISQIVNPRPSVTGVAAPTRCSNIPTNVTFAGIPATTTFTWTSALPGGLSGSAGGGSGNVINESIANIASISLTGIYSITPTDVATGCIGNITTIPQVILPIPTVTSSNTDQVCSGNIFNYTITGNIVGSTFTWSRAAVANIVQPATLSGNSLISERLTNITTTPVTVNYVITVTSAASCTNPATFNLAVVVAPTPTIIGFNAIPSICSGFSANIVPTSNISGTVYTYAGSLFSGNVAGFTTSFATTTGVADVLSGNGIARYAITPVFNGCAGASVNADQPVNPIPTITGTNPPPICTGQSTLLTVSGASAYDWSPATGLNTITGSSVTANPTTTTTYLVTATLAGCVGSRNITVTVNTPPTLSGTASAAYCVGQGATLSVAGANTYVWSPASGLNTTTGPVVFTTITSSLNYSVTGLNTVTGCNSTYIIPVTVNPLPTITGSGLVTICQGQSAILSVSGNATSYSWSPATSLSATTGTSVSTNAVSSIVYTVTGQNGAGCFVSHIIPVNVNALPTLSGTGAMSICLGQSTPLTVSGGNNYTWSPPTGLNTTTGASVVASPTGSTSYLVTGTNTITGCTNTLNIPITVNPGVTLTGNNTFSYCNGSSATLTVAGADIYSWNPSIGLNNTNGPTVITTATSSIVYSVLGTNTTTGCSNTYTISVSVNPNPTVTGANPSPYCQGQSTILTVTGASTYSWSPAMGLNTTTGSTVTTSSTNNIDYTVTGFNGPGCSSTHIVNVIVNTTPAAPLVTSPVTYCQFATPAQLTASGANLRWYTTITGGVGSAIAPTPSTSSVGTTSYFVADLLGSCESTRSQINVVVNPSPSPPNVVTPVNLCQNTAASPLSFALPPTNPLWYTTSIGGLGVSSITPITSATGTTVYYATQSAFGCESQRAAVTVNVSPAPSIAGTGSLGICQGQSAILTVTGATSFSWAPSTGLNTSTGGSVVSTATSSVVYTVTGSTGSCTQQYIISLSVNPIPVVNVSGNNNICAGSNSSLLATGASTFNWQPGNLSGAFVTVSPSSTTTYTITGTTSGCTGSTLFTITVNPGVIAPSSPSGATSLCRGVGSSTYATSSSLSSINATTIGWAMSGGGASTIDANTGAVTWDPVFEGIATISVIGFGCNGSASSNVIVTINGLPTVTGTFATDPSSCAASDGVITMAGTGASPFQYSIDGGFSFQSSNLFSGLGSGSYFTVVRDVNNCASTASQVDLTVPGIPPTPVISGGNTYCNPTSIANITVASSVSAQIELYADAALTILLSSTNGTNLEHTPLTIAGTQSFYARIVTSGCSSLTDGPVDIVINTPPAPIVSSPVAYCENDPNAVDLVPNGAGYTWYDASIAGNNLGTNVMPNTALVGETFFFVSETVNGCESPLSMVVVTITSSTSAGCNCNAAYDVANLEYKVCNNAIVNILTTLQGTQPYTLVYYEDYPISNTITITGITDDNYRISITGVNPGVSSKIGNYRVLSVKDANDCDAALLANRNFVVEHFANPTITGVINPPTVCSGNTVDITSSATVSSVGGVFTYYTNQSDADASINQISNANALTTGGTYIIRYDDSNNCFASAPVNVNFAASPTAVLSGTQTICGGSTTNLIVNFTGTAPWTLVYNDGVIDNTLTGINTNPFIFNVTPGATTTYTLQSVSDISGCPSSTSGSATITVLPSSDPLCNCAATARFVPGGIVGSFCSGASTSYNLAVSVSGSNVNGMEILQNGANPLTFTGLVPDANSFVLLPVFPTTTTNYSISFVYTNTCSGIGSGTAQVDVYPSPSLVGSNMVSPPCGQFVVDITTVLSDINNTTGTVDYWQDAMATVVLNNPTAVSVAGVYYVRKGTLSGCTDIQPVQVVFPPAIVASMIGNSSICPGNPATINLNIFNGTAPYDVIYSDGSNNISLSGVSAGNTPISVNPLSTTGYNILSIIDATGCTGSISGNAMVTILPAISCSGCTLPASPAASVAAGASCGSFNAIWNTIPGVNYYEFDLATDNAFVNTITGFYGLSLPGNNQIVSGVGDGSYFFRVRAINNCGTGSYSSTVNTSVTNTIDATISGGGLICNGQTALLQFDFLGTPPFTYTLADGSNIDVLISNVASFTKIKNPSVPTTYTITDISSAGCITTLSGVSVSVTPVANTVPGVSIIAPNTASCSAGIFIFTAVGINGGSAPSYIWYLNGNSVPGVNGQVLTLAGINHNDSVSVSMIAGGAGTACLTSNVANSAYTKLTINNIGGNPYYRRTLCSSGNEGVLFIDIPQENRGRIFTYTVNTLSGSANGSFTVAGLGSSKLFITITDSLNPQCQQVIADTLGTGTVDAVVSRRILNPSCSGMDGILELNLISAVVPTYNMSLSGIASNTMPFADINLSNLVTNVNQVFTGLGFGQYILNLNYNNCSLAPDTLKLNGAVPPVAELGANINICLGESVTLTTPGLSAGAYRWFKNDTLLNVGPNSITVLPTQSQTKYSVVVPGSNGCEASDYLFINASSLSMKLSGTQYSNETSVDIKWHVSNINGFPDDTLAIDRRDASTFSSPWQNVGFANKSDSSYTNISVPTSTNIYEYRITGAKSTQCVSNIHNTILLAGTNDMSQNTVSLSWNSYKGWKNGVKEYQIWRKVDNENQFVPLQTPSNRTDTTITLTDVTLGFDHVYRVLAISNEPTIDSIQSWSNTVKLHFARDINIYNVMTPNGDSKNENFQIDNIEAYPNSEVFIVNRWGGRVYYAKPYKNDWLGGGAPDGTYFYIVNLGDGSGLHKGSILLQR